MSCNFNHNQKKVCPQQNEYNSCTEQFVENNNNLCSTNNHCGSCQCNEKNNNKYYEKNCCCKKDLRESFELLSSSLLSSYINFSSFTLYTQSIKTAVGATTLKSIVSCNCDLIEYSDSSSFNTASLCDLVGYSFQLVNPTTNLPLFASALDRILCNCKGNCKSYECPKNSCSCNCDCDDCCCNEGKSAKLSNALGPINLYVNGTLGPILGATLLAIDCNMAWLALTTTTGSPVVPITTIYAIPMCSIALIG